jgi:hypothetical protein
LNYPYVEIICNELNMDWNKMNSIVIMEYKFILFITIVIELKETSMKKENLECILQFQRKS